MKKITVTENNFNDIISKIQETTDRYKMFRFYRVYDESMKEKKQYRNSSVRFYKHRTLDLEKDKIKTSIRFFHHSSYIEATKHHFRKAFETNGDSYDVRLYNEMKSLIYLDLSAGRALVLGDGDRIQFLPFGGFITWTDDNGFSDGKLSIYKQTFIPDWIYGKIANLDEEKRVREEEWEKELASYERMSDIGYDDE